MECTVTCFERVLHQVKPLKRKMRKEALRISMKESFVDFLDFCVENGCFTQSQATTLYEGIVMWEDLESNYWEEDDYRIGLLYSAVGL